MVPDSIHDVSDSEEWVDVRMTDPAEGEWDVDVVVLDGQVQALDLRIRRDLLDAFVDCLLEDVDAERRDAIVERLRGDDGDETAE